MYYASVAMGLFTGFAPHVKVLWDYLENSFFFKEMLVRPGEQKDTKYRWSKARAPVKQWWAYYIFFFLSQSVDGGRWICLLPVQHQLFLFMYIYQRMFVPQLSVFLPSCSLQSLVFGCPAGLPLMKIIMVMAAIFQILFTDFYIKAYRSRVNKVNNTVQCNPS